MSWLQISDSGYQDVSYNHVYWPKVLNYTNVVRYFINLEYKVVQYEN